MNALLDTRPTPDAEALANLACETLSGYLAALLSDPRDDGWALRVLDARHQALAIEAADLLRDEHGRQAIPLGHGELPAEELNLRPVLTELARCKANALDEYLRVFGLVLCRECPPYETEYHPNEDTFFRSQQMADVAGFYRAFGVHPGASRHERPDHVALELEFAALLLRLERLAGVGEAAAEAAQLRDTCRHARAAFVRDHLAWWVPSFSLALRHKAEAGLYERAGRALAALMPIERARLGIEAPSLPILRPTPTEPAHACEGCAASGLR
jgi:TorA maturation chaperone TorD